METKERRRIKKRERPLVLGLYILFWTVALVMFSGLFISQMENYNNLQAEITRLNSEITRAQAEHAELENQLTFFDSDAYMEQLARNMLGMVRPNEIVFRNIAE